jgi:membrane protease YdiL (CAAX protease family)
MLLFLAIAGSTVLLVQVFAFAAAIGLHFFPHETTTQMMKDPRLLVPAMFVSYLVAGLASILIFSAMWHRPFAEGVHWDMVPVLRSKWMLMGFGLVLSVVVQVLSNFLPIPKQLPIDDFFRTPADVWMVAVFGTFVAPVFEELAFRGFLLPSLATAWDWVTAKFSKRIAGEVAALQPPAALPLTADANPVASEVAGGQPLLALAPLRDPGWSPAALVFATTLTSFAFALLHSDQLAHAIAPLFVLFGVSVVLCLVRLRFHSMAASALVHACYNGTIFVALFVTTDGFRHLEKLKQ